MARRLVMNPWDNFVLALSLSWPGYLIGLGLCLAMWIWIHSIGNRPPSDQFTDERYEDGFYVPKRRHGDSGNIDDP